MSFTYSPRWAPHVTSTITDRVMDEDGHFEEQKINMQCSVCGDTHQATCNSGAVRVHVQNYALAHTHNRDPMKGPPGS